MRAPLRGAHGPVVGPIGGARRAVVAHLRFLEDTGYQRSEFDEERLGKTAEALSRSALPNASTGVSVGDEQHQASTTTAR